VEKHEPDTPDCLDTLGLDRSATEDDVREAFRAQSKELHPDHGGNPAAFPRLRDAYERWKRYRHEKTPDGIQPAGAHLFDPEPKRRTELDSNQRAKQLWDKLTSQTST
jgi:hypothetical protein